MILSAVTTAACTSSSGDSRGPSQRLLTARLVLIRYLLLDQAKHASWDAPQTFEGHSQNTVSNMTRGEVSEFEGALGTSAVARTIKIIALAAVLLLGIGVVLLAFPSGRTTPMIVQRSTAVRTLGPAPTTATAPTAPPVVAPAPLAVVVPAPAPAPAAAPAPAPSPPAPVTSAPSQGSPPPTPTQVSGIYSTFIAATNAYLAGGSPQAYVTVLQSISWFSNVWPDVSALIADLNSGSPTLAAINQVRSDLGLASQPTTAVDNGEAP